MTRKRFGDIKISRRVSYYISATRDATNGFHQPSNASIYIKSLNRLLSSYLILLCLRCPLLVAEYQELRSESAILSRITASLQILPSLRYFKVKLLPMRLYQPERPSLRYNGFLYLVLKIFVSVVFGSITRCSQSVKKTCAEFPSAARTPYTRTYVRAGRPLLSDSSLRE
jgi:hypothetical protein